MIVMQGKKFEMGFTAVCVVFACVSLLSSQSLVEIAKKEKERRAALRAKGKTSVVVTNADLKKQTRLPISAAKPQDSTSQSKSQARQQTPSPPRSQTTSQQETAERNLARDVYGYRKNATKVIFSTGPVKNPKNALDRPDDQFAEISENGVLDLEFNAKNGNGADIAIYVRTEFNQEMSPGRNEEDGIPLMIEGVDPIVGYWYGILGMNGRGDWMEIGKGKGLSNPEEFDLGGISDIKKIRIMFKPKSQTLNAKSFRSHSGENKVGIDAVEALH
jgi:hypothetical protein